MTLPRFATAKPPSATRGLKASLPALSLVQTAFDATVPALHMATRNNLLKFAQPNRLPQSWLLAVLLPFPLPPYAKRMHRDCHGMPRACNERCTVYLPDYHGNAKNAATRSYLQLRTWEHIPTHVPAAQLQMLQHVPAFVPTAQIQMWDHVPTPSTHAQDKNVL